MEEINIICRECGESKELLISVPYCIKCAKDIRGITFNLEKTIYIGDEL
jgi:hypothetical protein